MMLLLAEVLAEARDRRGVHTLTDRYYTCPAGEHELQCLAISLRTISRVQILFERRDIEGL